jgi:diacylglycerol O-acyltransferase
MRRLSGQDAYCLYRETPSVLMHTLKLAVCDPPDPRSTPGQLRDDIEKHLHLLPPLRRRLVEVPLGFHHPVWIEDPDFDLDFHVHHVDVEPPGGPHELDAAVSEIASKPLDRGRPLWELWALEGLDGNRVAYALKLHHAVADGVATAALIEHSAARDAFVGPPPAARPWTPEPVPSAARLLADALRDHLRQLARLPDLLLRTFRGLRALRRRRRDAPVHVPGLFDAPPTRFNRALGTRRTFATTHLSLDECLALKSDLGVTLNDLVLALCAGALRRYLGALGELPRVPLSASVPVSADRADAGLRLSGNRVAYLQTALHVELEDPLERLAATREVTDAAKRELGVLGLETMADWMDYLPPRPYAWVKQLQYRLRLADRAPSPSNLVISNVPGPREPLFWSGARMHDLYSVGPLSEGMGLNFTIWSYCGRMYVGAIACRDAVPDLHELCDLLHLELSALQQAASVRG